MFYKIILYHSYTDDSTVTRSDDVYEKPWTRNMTYFMGMILAYIIYKTGGEIRVSKVWVEIIYISDNASKVHHM